MNRLYITVLLFVLLAACRSTKQIQTAISKIDSTTTVVTPVKDFGHEDSIAFIKETYAKIQGNHISFTTFSGKADVDFEDSEGKKYNVTAHVRMYKDSVIWISITAILGIEGLRAYITRDSVKLMDKQNKIYTARSVSYLQEVTALPLDLPSLQELIIGNPVFLDTSILSYNKSGNSISLLSNGSFFKNLLSVEESTKLLQSSKLDDQEAMRNRTCHLTYADYERNNDMNFPTKRTISVAEKKKIDIKLDFRQFAFNETLSFPFSVPKNYKRN